MNNPQKRKIYDQQYKIAQAPVARNPRNCTRSTSSLCEDTEQVMAANNENL